LSPEESPQRVVVVQLSPAVAGALRDAGPSSAEPPAGDIVRLADDAGVRLEPLHPDIEEGELMTDWYAVVPDDDAGTRLVDTLRGQPGVEAAYVKPPDAAP
jgi:hypothetical protein